MNALRESRKPSVAGEMPRRDFLKLSVAASGGLLIGFYLPGMQPEAQAATFAPNAFVRIGTDDSVTVTVNHSGMGQGVFTALPMILSYGQLAESAAKIAPPQQVALKDPKDFKLIGKPLKRLDTPEKTNGKGIFGIDVKAPGMLTAVVARSPVFGGKLKSVNADKAKAVKGVRKVVEVPSGVAVIADGFWAAKRGRDALQIEWDEGPMADFNTKSQREQYAELAKQPGLSARKEGDASGAIGSAAKKIEAVYEVPYLSHAMMEPLNCAVDLRADGCEIWTGTQFQTVDRMSAAGIAGLKPEQVQIHTTLLGGGFGRRANPASDFVSEAVHVAKAAGAPVKVIWTREDDMHGGYYRPMYYHSLIGGGEAGGKFPARLRYLR